jgi:hypothetical protein
MNASTLCMQWHTSFMSCFIAATPWTWHYVELQQESSCNSCLQAFVSALGKSGQVALLAHTVDLTSKISRCLLRTFSPLRYASWANGVLSAIWSLPPPPSPLTKTQMRMRSRRNHSTANTNAYECLYVCLCVCLFVWIYYVHSVYIE